MVKNFMLEAFILCLLISGEFLSENYECRGNDLESDYLVKINFKIFRFEGNLKLRNRGKQAGQIFFLKLRRSLG